MQVAEVFTRKFDSAHRNSNLELLLCHCISNGKSVVVRINDRGPFCAGRIIDLSYSKGLKQLI